MVIEIYNDRRSTLKQQGGLNPYALKVQDPLFVNCIFFNPADYIQVKYEMLRKVMHGIPVTTSVSSFGLSRQTFYKIKANFEERGFASFMPQQIKEASRLINQKEAIAENYEKLRESFLHKNTKAMDSFNYQLFVSLGMLSWLTTTVTSLPQEQSNHPENKLFKVSKEMMNSIASIISSI
jgi:transposase